MGIRVTKRRRVVECLWVGAVGLMAGATALATLPFETTRQNFYTPGTQPGTLTAGMVSPQSCEFCHNEPSDPGSAELPYGRWAASMMGQAARDPIFHAAFAIAQQDARFVGESCLRCHMPEAWVSNKVKYDLNDDPQNTNYGKTLFNFSRDPMNPNAGDMMGVSCSTCHRMVDPIFQSGVSPSFDWSIISALNNDSLDPPVPGYPAVLENPHNAAIVLDPLDRRRGPFDLDPDWVEIGFTNFPYHDYLHSPFHLSSRHCATCHDVSTPHFTRAATPNPDGTYAYTMNAVDTPPHPDKYMQFPEQRTFSEWSESLFGSGPINLAGRFGGLGTAYSSCQDCHMPTTSGQGCVLDAPDRPTATNPLGLPSHNFNGANSWVLRAVAKMYSTPSVDPPGYEIDAITGLTFDTINESIARNLQMLGAASDLELSRASSQLRVRIVNYSGHKLPTGYNEGRRMWINVRFLDGAGGLVAERGAYETASATLTTSDTKVYEMKIGPDAVVAAIPGVNVQEGPGFRLVLSNKIYKDNRIPPMGFSNAAFEAVQAGHIPRNQYADGQYWDDTIFGIPPLARRAEVRVFYQTTSKEYIEFLRDANTAAAPNAGTVAYDLWTQFGKSEPVQMDFSALALPCRCDTNADGVISIDDLFLYINLYFTGSADIDGNGITSIDDLFLYFNCYFTGCAGF